METITYEVKGTVGWLILNRPDQFNAFTPEMNQEVIQALKKAARDSEIRAVVITGNGKAFCAGQDLGSVTEDLDFGEVVRKRYNPMVKAVMDFEKPLVAAVNGAAAGAGLGLALLCDFRVASDKAKFTTAFMNIGLVPDTGNLFTLPRIVGYAKAMELVVLGHKLRAEEAKEWGLVTEVYEHESFHDETQVFTERLAAMPTKAFGLVKRYMHKSFETSLEEMLEHEAGAQRTAGMTDDHAEGVKAFMEKRKPTFTGK